MNEWHLRIHFIALCLASTRMSVLNFWKPSMIFRIPHLTASLTHWDRDKIAAILQTTFANVFSLMEMCEFGLRLHWRLSLRFVFTVFQHCSDNGFVPTSHYLNQRLLVYWRINASLGLNESIPYWYARLFAQCQILKYGPSVFSGISESDMAVSRIMMQYWTSGSK